MPQTNTLISKKKKPVNTIRVLFILFCITIPILNWLIFYVYTNFSAFFMAFMNKDGVWSFDNFIRFFNEFTLPTSQISEAFRNTFLTFGILLITFPLKVLVSYFIYKKVPGYNFFRIVFFFPTIIFSVAVSMVFTRMVGESGIVSQVVRDMVGLDYIPELLADSRFANWTVLANMIWIGFPGDLIIWGGTFARIPTEVLESGRIDGVNWWTEFTKITVPMVWPTVSLQMVLMFCGIFGASGNVFLLTKGDYGTMTLSAWMYLQMYNNVGTVDTTNVFNYLSAVGLCITVIAVTISLLIRRWTDKAFEEVEF